MKRELANARPTDIYELGDTVLDSIEGIRNSPAKLRGCIAHTGLPFSMP